MWQSAVADITAEVSDVAGLLRNLYIYTLRDVAKKRPHLAKKRPHLAKKRPGVVR